MVWPKLVHRAARRSRQSAIREAREAAAGGKELDPERRDYELAHHALKLAALTFSFFLEHSQRTLRHGFGPAVLQIIFDSDAFVAEGLS